MAASSPRAGINSSAAHVFDVLRFVTESAEPLGVTEISRRIGLPASTVYRALVTLEETNYIQRYQNTPHFELGMTPHLLNRALLNRFALHAHTRPQLHALASETGYTVSLWCRLGWYGFRAGGAFGSQDVFHRARLGETEAMHHGPGPLIILAHLSADEQRSYKLFLKRNFPQHSPDTAGWMALEKQMATASRHGFAFEALATARDFHAVALPIRDPNGIVVASLMTEGAAKADTAIKPSKAMCAARAAIETELHLNHEHFISPFAHISPDDIIIKVFRR